MKKIALFLLFLIFVVLSGCGIDKNKPYEMESFTYTNQNGKPFGVENLKGKVWIADFIFTNCETVCPPMTASMAKLQQKLQKENLEVELVSFSVDPTVDTPEKLKTYLEKFTQDDLNWNMLTGYTQEEIEKFAREQFQTLVQKPQSSDQVIHATNLYLVDQNGKIVNDYGFQSSHYNEIIKDINKLY
ncbi:cytochrome c oxidase assembly protein [Bacillus sp. M6-12]|uniref:SCO family protein n=1 Tax=Bacillus sp. M6-12 TaxID=2054166 RepID=UPI000C761FDF|nr:SCO family protein [Bacillus sp. M6-12]PLS18213.1 cytochrome c oxidase assembly protein [Bacillus sp. M6-12]